MQPPEAPRRPFSITQHGRVRQDDYFWLRSKEDPQTAAYLQAENAYLEAALAHTSGLQQTLVQEFKGRLVEDDCSVPETSGPYETYTRMEPGKQYPVYCRRLLKEGAPEEILLNQNELARGMPFCALGAVEISPDNNLLAYAVDFNGSESFTIFIKDLQTGELLADQILNTVSYLYLRTGVVWSADSQSLLYTTYDHAHRPDRVFLHRLGTEQLHDRLVHHEPDEAYALYLSKSRSKEYIFMRMRSHKGTEVRFLPASHPETEPGIVQPRQHNLEYSVEHLGSRFYIATNEQAENFRLMAAPVHSPDRENWVEVVPHREDTLIEDIYPFEGYLVLLERRGGLKQIRISEHDGQTGSHYVNFPEPAYSLVINTNPEYRSGFLRFTYSSLVTPNSVVDYDMQEDRWILRKQDRIPSGYDSSLYISQRLVAEAKDGKQVPISLVYRKDLELDGGNPLLLYGYGSYGYSIDPVFNAQRLSLLDRGIIFAIAHVRGGAEMGRAWYEQGRLLNKMNSFTDFIACAERLVSLNYTSQDRLAIWGRSAGGLLVGASMLLRPDLYKAVVAQVPFVDVINTMSDPSIPLTVIEYDQWGNPDDLEFYEAMLAYSPYDNLRPGRYPDILLTTGMNDPRVAFWEPAKFAARLRQVRMGDSLVLLRTDFDAGHGGASGRYKALEELALVYAFIIDRLSAPYTNLE